MLISGFDGRNCSLSISALEFKCLRYLIENADINAYKIASSLMKEDGFHFSDDEIITIAKQMLLVTRQLNAQITNEPDDDNEEADDVSRPQSKTMLQ